MIERNKHNQLTKQDKILISNMIDKYENYKKSGRNTYSNFLNPYELNLVISYFNYYHIQYSIYEPYPFLEKKIIYFGEYDNFVTFYQISAPKELSHSQVLGSLFSIGFNENTIGDIFIEKGICYYTNLTKMNNFLEENLSSVGHQIVKLDKINEINLQENHFESFTILVSSMRLDNIVSKITNKSRSQVGQMFLDKRVLLNYSEVKNTSIFLKENDILSIRKVGKFKIGKQQGITKKENMILEIYKYI